VETFLEDLDRSPTTAFDDPTGFTMKAK